MPEPIPDDGIYDFADDDKPPPQTGLPPQPVYDPAAPPVLGYRSATVGKPPAAEPEAITDLYLPLGLLAGGVFIRMLSTVIWSHHVSRDFLELAIDLTLGTGVMLVAMLIAARFRGINLGKLGVAAYKLAAISVAPEAIVMFLSPISAFIPLGFILVWIVQFILFFALLGALFDLQESDTWFCVWMIFFTRLGFLVILRAFF